MPAASDKISTTFAHRLEAMPPDERVSAVLLLAGAEGLATGGRRRSADRQEESRRVRSALGGALSAIDEVLARHHGSRATDLSALGSVAVETTVTGIRALADNPSVAAILEDQPVSLVR